MRRYRFLLPLIVPAALFVLAVANGLATNGEARPARAPESFTIFEIAFYPVLFAVALCGPAFWSGWLFRKDREAGPPSLDPRPGASLPPPPPRPPGRDRQAF